MSKEEGKDGAAELDFRPFYSKSWIPRLSNGVCSLVTATLLGGLFAGAHTLASKRALTDDSSWFLALLIGATWLLLSYATHRARVIGWEMGVRFDSKASSRYFELLRRDLPNKGFLITASLIGLVNCSLGSLFGLPHDAFLPRLTILIGFFLAGFVNGLALFGIFGVVKVLNESATLFKGSLNFSAPDRCGGMAFIGEALSVFSAVTLAAGVMGTVYILRTDWRNEDNVGIYYLMWIWIVLPYVMSLTVLIAPALGLFRVMTEYKLTKEKEVAGIIAKLVRQLDSDRLKAEDRAELRERYSDSQK